MRIGIMLRHIGEAGGIVTYTHNLLRAFLRQGPEHTYCLFYASPRHRGRFQGPNVEEYVLPGRNKLLWDQWQVPRLARRIGVEVIFNPKLSIPLFSPVPPVLVLRPEQFVHPELFRWWDRIYFKTFIPLYCRAARFIIAPTHAASRDIVRYVGADPNKMVTVHEAAGDHFFAPPPPPQEVERIRRKYSLPERYVLFVGGLTPLKNFERLVRAFALVRQEEDIELVVVGFRRWKFEQDLAFARNHPVSKHIHFPGFVEDQDLPTVYRLATCLFFPSIYEGFGIPVCEAFATGCPVITSNRGCSPEVAGDAAVLVNPFEVEDMAAGLHRVVSQPALRAELAAKGRRRAPYFRFSRTARQTLEVLSRAARGDL